MVLYRLGAITWKNGNTMIFESGATGYQIIVPDPERFETKTKIRMYIYEYKTDYYQAAYGFKDFKERILFGDLVAIQGIGPRAAFHLLNGGWEKTVDYIAAGNVEALAKINYVNNRIARLIVTELQRKYQKNWGNKSTENDDKKDQKTTTNLVEVKETLKMLGFKRNQIENVIAEIPYNADVDTMVEDAIKLISKNYEQSATQTH
ncbi:Holliday junction branch migration protein RuvA [Mycoplasmopsis columbinasalis]|uniref:Holliday junction branch migration complex subunit RuvA n=1 Tax=Mycoplasmopsis columbinasalis TaxID=114880 RepID=A0A449BAI3_9BACT|nr:Holliday junction branch migration protein RuvA [Mycoplasmopsis columbinasalis]VEU78179.1 Holliday junction DNA helicase RuvA [Mycoplasmopsis columbinasalis]